MQPHYQAIRDAGGDVLVVTLSRPAVLSAYLKENPWPFDVVGDPELQGYRAFGLERAHWRTYLKPRVILGYLRLLFSGWKLRMPYQDEDVHQLGGDFILDENRRLAFQFRSKEPTDRPGMDELLGILSAQRTER